MSGPHEALEHAEHAAHGGGHGHAPASKLIGLTMGLIGVLIAFCAAMVGSERNELTRTMIEQTQSHADYTSASTKFRLVMMELEKQRLSPAAAPGVELTTPDLKAAHAVLERFVRLYVDYSKERSISKTWADSYAPLIEAHFEAAEGYERAQLIAEIGIVISSLAVLLASRSAWLIAVVLGVVCIGQLGRTYFHTREMVLKSGSLVEHSEEAYKELRKAHGGANEDEKTVELLDPGAKIRNAIAAAAAEHEASAKQGSSENHEAAEKPAAPEANEEKK